MKILFKLGVVVSVMFLELVFIQVGGELLFGRSHGQMVEVEYRRDERVATFFDYHEHESPATEAKFKEELRLMHKHEDWKMYLAVGVFVTINGIGSYYYFRSKRHSDKSTLP